MRNLLLVLAGLLLVACDDVPCECQCPPAVQLRQQNLLLRSSSTVVAEQASKKVVVCSPDKSGSCEINVPVTLDKSGQCYADLQYCVICMRKGKLAADGSRALPKFTWTLTVDGKPTKRFAFRTNNGIDIYFANATGKADFGGQGHDTDGDSTFKWEAGPDRSDILAHGSEVYDKDSGNACKPTDPVIVNTD